MPDAVEDLLGTRVARSPGRLRRLLLARRAERATCACDELAAIAGRRRRRGRARTAGVLRVDGERVRAVAPAARGGGHASARARASGASCTARSPRVVDDPQLRALHLALATERPGRGARRGAWRPRPRDAVRARRAPRRRCSSPSTRCGSRRRTRRSATSACSRSPPTSRRAGELQRLTDLLEPAIDDAAAGRAAGARLAAAVRGRRTARRSTSSSAISTSRWPSARTTRALRALRAGQEGRADAAASRVDRIREAEAWALEALLGRAGRARRRAARAVRARRGRARCAGAPIDDLCARSAPRRDAASYIADRARAGGRPAAACGAASSHAGAGGARRGCWRSPTSAASPRPTRSSGCTCASWSCARASGTPRSGGSTSGRESAEGELLIRPMYQRCRALLAAGRGDAGRGRALGRRRDRARGGDRLALGLARGAARARASRRCWRASRRARPSACARCGSTPSARASTSPACSRSRPSWSRRWSSRRARRGARGRPSGCGRWPSATSTRGGWSTARAARAGRARRVRLRRRRGRALADAAAEYGAARPALRPGALAAQRSAARSGG